MSYPRVPGHEIAGTVAAIGEDVEGLPIGQAVTVVPYFNCGMCRACRMGRANACLNNQTMGVQREGAMTRRIVVPAGKVLPVPACPCAITPWSNPAQSDFTLCDVANWYWARRC